MNITHQDTVSGLVLVALALAVVWLSLDMGTGAGAEPQFCAAGLCSRPGCLRRCSYTARIASSRAVSRPA